jgi:divalent metal cation (Fe/Co/Zn/Cd) transporter
MRYRRALRWSIASVAWTLLASGIAIGAGLVAGSLLLIAFGAIGLLDAAGSAVLVTHFRHALHHEAMSDRRERFALVAIACGMTVIAAGTAAMSVRRLLDDNDVKSSPLGIAIAGLSVVVLAVLARGKHDAGTRVNSRALIADAHVSAMGAGFALFTVGGTLSASALGWSFVDPIGSLLIAGIAVVVAGGHARHAA